MQLVEQSLDTNLLNNAVKLKFPHCTVLPGGVIIQETLNNVILLVSTNQSVHRLVLPHPTRMYRSVSKCLCHGNGYNGYTVTVTHLSITDVYLSSPGAGDGASHAVHLH